MKSNGYSHDSASNGERDKISQFDLHNSRLKQKTQSSTSLLWVYRIKIFSV